MTGRPRAPAAPRSGRRAARGGGALTLLACSALAGVLALLGARAADERARPFVGGRGSAGRVHDLRPDAPGSRGGAGGAGERLVARAAFSWDADAKPSMPRSTQEMVQQAADAVMRAYREGNTRQAIRLRLDEVFDMEQIYLKGQPALLNASLPMMRSFAARLWGGESMKKVRVSIVDEEVGTLIYREAEQEQMDVAVLYLPGRKLVAEPKMQKFLGDMKDRLVIMSNPQNAPDPWYIESKGEDFNAEGAGKFGASLCETFQQQSYYYSKGAFNNWQLTVFRAYPFEWEYYIEDLNYTTTLIATSETKLDYYQTIRAMEKYEAENGVRPTQKVGKMIKDSVAAEQASEEREPGWRNFKQDF